MCVKICFLLNKSAAETVLMLQDAFKEEALSKTRLYVWICRFKGREKSCEDQLSSGRTSKCRNNENHEKVHNANNADFRRTINDTSEITGLSWNSCQRILTEDLYMKLFSSKFVPKCLIKDQKIKFLNIYYDLREQ